MKTGEAKKRKNVYKNIKRIKVTTETVKDYIQVGKKEKERENREKQTERENIRQLR